jgi:peptidoglycan/LPS O-acetylase OafA/YrhL
VTVRGPAAPPGRQPALDGLRALAILVVVAYHARVPAIAGGYIGVDVFFVLSGYLITGILLREHAATGTISIADFYARRARRLLPALSLMLLATSAVAWTAFHDARFRQSVGTQTFTSSLFIQNIYLIWSKQDYFAEATAPSPLTHTWSLSVEEQFYLFWPLLMIVTLGYAKRRSAAWPVPLVVVLLCVLSFISAQVSRAAPTVAFYSPLSRIGEVGVGALIAWWLVRGDLPKTSGLAAWAGVAGVLGAAVLFDQQSIATPWQFVLPVVSGGVIIIAASAAPRSIVPRTLSSTPLTWIGERSYGWYLWHFPALVMTRELFPNSSTAVAVAAGGSLLAAHLSYRLVETPIRRQTLSIVSTTRRTLLAGMSCVTLMAGFGLTVRDYASRQVVDGGFQRWLHARCAQSPRRELGLGAVCEVGSQDPTAKRILLWGDSHARHFAPLVDSLGKALGFRATVRWLGGCAPLFSPLPMLIANPEKCRRTNDSIFTVLTKKATPFAGVVLAARWSFYFGMPPRDSSRLANFYSRLGDWDTASVRRLTGHVAERTVARLGSVGVPVLVLAQVPEWRHAGDQCGTAPYHACADSESILEQFDRGSVSALRRATGANANARLALLGQLFCHAGRCGPERNGENVYFDANHLTVSGALGLTGDLRCAFEDLLASSRRLAGACPVLAR